MCAIAPCFYSSLERFYLFSRLFYVRRERRFIFPWFFYFFSPHWVRDIPYDTPDAVAHMKRRQMMETKTLAHKNQFVRKRHAKWTCLSVPTVSLCVYFSLSMCVCLCIRVWYIRKINKENVYASVGSWKFLGWSFFVSHPTVSHSHSHMTWRVDLHSDTQKSMRSI